MFNVIIAGSRDFSDYKTLCCECDRIIQRDDVTIISGGARGADSLAIRYAKSRGYELDIMKADWDNYGKSAGYVRNSLMCDVGDMLIAFWDGESHGTEHMIDISEKAGLEVHVIKFKEVRKPVLSKKKIAELSKRWGVNPHISAEWDEVIEQDLLTLLLKQDKDSRKAETLIPKHKDILNAFKFVEFSDVKCVIVGQDPYPGKDRHGRYHAHGLSFSSLSDEIPASLKNIFTEIEDEYGIVNTSADLTPWTDQGVLLLNRQLTVVAGEPGSGAGWDVLTTNVIRKLSERDQPTVYMLWGKQAQEVEWYIHKSRRVKILKATHPSPMSANRGFFGCNHFIKCNDFLEKQGVEPIDWRT